MSRYVADKHALVWHLTLSPRLSSTARACFERDDLGQAQILVPSFSVVEMVDLAERSRIPSGLVQEVVDRMSRP